MELVIAVYYTTSNTYYAACIIVALLCVLRLRRLVQMLGWRGLMREIRETIESIGG